MTSEDTRVDLAGQCFHELGQHRPGRGAAPGPGARCAAGGRRHRACADDARSLASRSNHPPLVCRSADHGGSRVRPEGGRIGRPRQFQCRWLPVAVGAHLARVHRCGSEVSTSDQRRRAPADDSGHALQLAGVSPASRQTAVQSTPDRSRAGVRGGLRALGLGTFSAPTQGTVQSVFDRTDGGLSGGFSVPGGIRSGIQWGADRQHSTGYAAAAGRCAVGSRASAIRGSAPGGLVPAGGAGSGSAALDRFAAVRAGADPKPRRAGAGPDSAHAGAAHAAATAGLLRVAR
ncbi:hypothetical protein D3C78_1220440 [compost metagenome]